MFQRRRHEREKAERVARGEPVPVTRTFDRPSRARIVHAITDAAPADAAGWGTPAVEGFLGLIRGILLREWGQFDLTRRHEPADDLLQFVVTGATDEELLDVIEATLEALQTIAARQGGGWELYQKEETFRSTVNRILDGHDLAYQVDGSKIVPRESMAMHADVVAPALSLLRGDARLANVERAFQAALTELKPGGDPADAITDAGTALQEMLVALGAEGNALGPLLNSARKRELLGPHDSKLAEGSQLIGDWVSADRSERGDVHGVKDTTPDDAWLAVHVVGALILRLGKRL